MKRLRDPLLLTHAGVVVGLAALLALLVATYDGPDANIGAGLVGVLLGVLGAPWSLVYFALEFLSDTENAAPAGIFVCLSAALNVVIHGAIRAWYAHRTSIAAQP